MATTSPKITIDADKPKFYEVDLIGKRYRVRTPKTALGLRIAQLAKDVDKDQMQALALIDAVIDGLFEKKDAAAVRKRLEDGSDDLDFEHLNLLLTSIMEAATDRPTTSKPV